MGKIVLARLISGHLVIAEKTDKGIKYPLFLRSIGRAVDALDFYTELAKDKEASKKVELPDSMIMGPTTEPLKEMEMKYRELRSGIKVSKSIIDPTKN